MESPTPEGCNQFEVPRFNEADMLPGRQPPGRRDRCDGNMAGVTPPVASVDQLSKSWAVVHTRHGLLLIGDGILGHELQKITMHDSAKSSARREVTGQLTGVEHTNDGLKADPAQFRRFRRRMHRFGAASFVEPQQVTALRTRSITGRARRFNGY